MLPKYVEITISIVIFLFVFFAVFLFTYRRVKVLSRTLLGCLFLALGLKVADVYMLTSGAYFSYPQLAYIFNTPLLLYGPLLWLLTKSVTQDQKSLKGKDFWHFLPFGVAIISTFLFYHLHTKEYKLELLRHATQGDDVINIWISFLILFSIVIYIVFSYRKLLQYRKALKEQVSNVDRHNLSWLEHTFLGFSTVIGFSILFQFISSIAKESHWLNILLLMLLFIMLLFVMSAIAKGLRSELPFIRSLNVENGPRPDLAADQLKLKMIDDFMQKEQPFLDADLSLANLATALDLPPRDLSVTINQIGGRSFFDFINSYRIEYAKSKIANSTDRKLTILEVMYASGFNSKSSFNTAFKKHTGLTPSQFKKKVHM